MSLTETEEQPLTEAEQQALKAIADLDGKATNKAVSESIGTSVEGTLFLCIELVKRNYAVFKPNRGFGVTPKGKQALDGDEVALAPPDVDLSARPVRPREGKPWNPVEKGSRGLTQQPAFSKPGQEPAPWNAVKVAGDGKSSAGGTMKKKWTPGPAELLYESTLLCSFCAGKGERPPGTKCPVCRGTGAVSLKPPVVVCAFCRGRGSKDTRNYVTCLVCRGRGYVEVEEGAVQCAACGGRGKETGSNLYCKACKGKGVVTPAISSTGRSMRVPVSGSELEVLKACCDAEDTGGSPNIPRRTRLTSAYVEMLRQRLCEKGLLTSVGARTYRTTDLGRELAALAKRKEKASHGS